MSASHSLWSAAVGFGISILASGAAAQTVLLDEAAFTEYAAQALRREVGDTPVSVKGPLTLSVGSLQANLDRIFAYCRRDRSGCTRELEHYTRSVAQVLKEQNAPIQAGAIRLVVRSSEYIERAQASLGNGGPVLQVKPLVSGLVAVAVLDTPRAVRPLDDRDLGKLGLSQDQLFELGAANLRSTLRPLSERAKPARSGQIGTLTGSSYEVGRVAVHAEWSQLAKAQKGILLVALPTTDVVLYISESSPVAIDALRTLARNAASKSSNPLSSAVLRWTEERWELVQ